MCRSEKLDFISELANIVSNFPIKQPFWRFIMLLTVLSAVALTVGGVMTAQGLNDEALGASQETAPVVEVAPIQQEDTTEPGELGW